MKRWAGHVVTTAREAWERRLPLPCALCPGVVDGTTPWVVEHLVPRSTPGAPDMSDVSNQWVSHRPCSDAQGGRMIQAKKKATKKATSGFRDWSKRAYERDDDSDTPGDDDHRPPARSTQTLF